MVEMKCHRCGHEWEYKGKSKYFTSCPQCKTSVKVTRKIQKQEIDIKYSFMKMKINRLEKEVRNMREVLEKVCFKSNLIFKDGEDKK